MVGTIAYTVITIALQYIIARIAEGEGSSGGSLFSMGGGDEYEKSIREGIVSPSTLTLQDIGGLQDAKDALRRAVLLPMQFPDSFFRGPKALHPPSGILLYGPPGTGKTLLARALASESMVPFISLSSANLESKWAGDSAKLIRAAFQVARKLQPAILFIDEIDGMGKQRSEMDQSYTYQFKVELLRNLDGVETKGENHAVVVIACTNCPASLDPALRRRLPCEIHISKPNEKERLDILRVIVRDEAKPPKDMERLAKETDGMTGSDLSSLYTDASALRLAKKTDSLEKALAMGTSPTAILSSAGRLLWKPHWQPALDRRKEALATMKSASTMDELANLARYFPRSG